MIDALLKEKIETLDGSRARAARGQAAARLDDLAAILQIPPRLRAAPAAGAAPTKAEYDALLKDLTDIHLRLLALAVALKDRLSS